MNAQTRQALRDLFSSPEWVELLTVDALDLYRFVRSQLVGIASAIEEAHTETVAGLAYYSSPEAALAAFLEQPYAIHRRGPGLWESDMALPLEDLGWGLAVTQAGSFRVSVHHDEAASWCSPGALLQPEAWYEDAWRIDNNGQPRSANEAAGIDGNVA